ncbi:MAG: hypothetical protein H6608_04790 [Flavobacteriales bacterium]|nr:hypothetical protein [Bacteroidota bacterium]MCB9240420.1 hypothetical protein [Flavobacteriales bacterium]
MESYVLLICLLITGIVLWTYLKKRRYVDLTILLITFLAVILFKPAMRIDFWLKKNQLEFAVTTMDCHLNEHHVSTSFEEQKCDDIYIVRGVNYQYYLIRYLDLYPGEQGIHKGYNYIFFRDGVHDAFYLEQFEGKSKIQMGDKWVVIADL